MMILTTGTDTILNRFPFATFIILMLAKGHDFIELNCNLTSALNDVCKWFKWLVLCYIVEKDESNCHSEESEVHYYPVPLKQSLKQDNYNTFWLQSLNFVKTNL